MPTYIARHYRFMRCAHPTLVPTIEEYERRQSDAKRRSDANGDDGGGDCKVRRRAESAENAMSVDVDAPPAIASTSTAAQLVNVDAHLNTVYGRITRAYALNNATEREQLLKLIAKDLNVSENVEEEIAVPLRLLRALCDLLLDYNATLEQRYDEVATLAIIEEASFSPPPLAACAIEHAACRASNWSSTFAPSSPTSTKRCSCFSPIARFNSISSIFSFAIASSRRSSARCRRCCARKLSARKGLWAAADWRGHPTLRCRQFVQLAATWSTATAECIEWAIQFAHQSEARAEMDAATSTGAGELEDKKHTKRIATLPLMITDTNVVLKEFTKR